MAIIESVEKRRLIITLGEHEAPAQWQWDCIRFLRDDQSGKDAAPPQPVLVDATADEVAEHLGKAATDQVASLNAASAAIAEKSSALDAANAQIADLQASVGALQAKLDAVAKAIA
jgi:flagellin-like hook-associated protein FlgL